MRKKRRILPGMAAALAAAFCLIFFSSSSLAASTDFEVTSSSYTGERDGGGTVSLTVENSGSDFGGYVRLLITRGTRADSAYAFEVYVSIAEDEEENIKIRIPRIEGGDLSDCEARVQVMDDHHNLKHETRLRHLFDDKGILYGVISDHPGNLTYFETDYYSGYNYLTGRRNGGMTQDSRDLSDLSDVSELGGLTYLMIDDFDSSDLTADGIQAIEEWVEGGGILMIGTGRFEDDSFKAFDSDFIDAKYRDTINGGRGVYNQYSYYAYSGDLEFADIDYGTSWGSNPGVDPYSGGNGDGIAIKRQGRGAVVLLSFSLSGRDLDESYFVSRVTEDCESLGISTGSGRGGLTASEFENILRDMQGPGRLNKVALRIIIILYIILIGPVLYLILKKYDKREKIWLAVPAVSLGFVALIFIIGQGFSVHTKVFESVTIAGADGNGEQVSYLLGFDSKAREWNITVKDDVVAAGPAVDDTYYGMDEDYRYLSSFSPSGTKLYYRPTGLFDSAYFKTAAPNAVDEGEFTCDLGVTSSGKIRGTVENDTPYDFDYLLVASGSYCAIADGLKAGEEADISEAGLNYGSSNISHLRNLAEERYDAHDYVGTREICALALAYAELSGNETFVVGVCTNKDRVIESGAREEAYLCIFGIGGEE